ncbi:M56 family metallopeptidase [Amycolatopsis sp. K13G38]|uniref:M56 family metallopeptidase n=1 Tax=Amycolatopsis acididurans TaxID=2724524 RepID=A0ABX1J8K5_9PSEU|nr:M56 family metallopeptidase [Amycolatopsis acididurans]NKQ55994.1 M56 family metallopeptidase [Amycolatopsis acididurans]
MDSGVFVPLLLPVAAWPLARLVTAGARPKTGVWLLVVAALALAGGSTAALCVLAIAGLSLVPAVARYGEWSAEVLRGMEIASVPVEVLSGLLLVAIAVSAVIGTVRHLRWLRGVVRTIDGMPAAARLVVLPDAEPLAFAIPWRGGRIVVSRSMLDALTAAERRALLTHEQAHLRCRHHLFLAAAGVAATLNPLLWPLRSAVVFLVERWADEATCARMGDRRVVASAVAKAALATRGRVVPVPAATAGPVPRRVAALLYPAAPRVDWRLVAGFAAAVTIAVTAWSAQASIEAAADLHAGIELASVGHHHHRHWPTA